MGLLIRCPVRLDTPLSGLHGVGLMRPDQVIRAMPAAWDLVEIGLAGTRSKAGYFHFGMDAPMVLMAPNDQSRD